MENVLPNTFPEVSIGVRLAEANHYMKLDDGNEHNDSKKHFVV